MLVIPTVYDEFIIFVYYYKHLCSFIYWYLVHSLNYSVSQIRLMAVGFPQKHFEDEDGN